MSDDYRQQYQAEVDQAKRENDIKLKALLSENSAFAESAVLGNAELNSHVIATDDDLVTQAFEFVKDSSKAVKLRQIALSSLSNAASDNREIFDYVVQLLIDNNQPIDLRATAMNLLRQLSFSSPCFAESIGKISDLFRGIIRNELIPREMKEMAIAFLSARNDEYAQSVLTEGLKNSEKALVTPLKALRWLSADSHYQDRETLQRYTGSSHDDETRELAVRMLAQDATSEILLANLLSNKQEAATVRQACAQALRAMKPDHFEEIAKKMVLDESDDANVRATLLSGLGLDQALNKGRDVEFRSAVEKLIGEPHEELKKSGEHYLRNYGQ